MCGSQTQDTEAQIFNGIFVLKPQINFFYSFGTIKIALYKRNVRAFF